VAAAPADRRLRLVREVVAELERAADDYEEASPGLGDRYLAAIDRALEVISAAPQRWPRVDARHHRYLVHRFPFSVFYRFDETEVIVVAIAHRRKRPCYWAGR